MVTGIGSEGIRIKLVWEYYRGAYSRQAEGIAFGNVCGVILGDKRGSVKLKLR
jgi:hypothetical protein